jgi:hypothetical protein
MLGQATVNILPGDVLLDVFDFYRGDDEYFTIEMWKSLVHVCQRWRSIIFAPPLVLQCDARTRVSELLDTWPPLPVIIRYSPLDAGEKGKRNMIAALGLCDRITGIRFEKIERLTAN